MSRYVLETERLRLRELEPSDTGDVREMLADAEARRIFERVVKIPDYAERWVARNQQRYREDGHGLWAMETKEDGAFAGDCGITYQQVGDDRLLEVGYHLTLAARGQGYASGAASACLRHAFDPLSYGGDQHRFPQRTFAVGSASFASSSSRIARVSSRDTIFSIHSETAFSSSVLPVCCSKLA